MTTKPKDTDSYIKTFSKAIQKQLQQVRTTIKQAIPDAEETIKYGIPSFVLNGRNLVHFGAFKNHIGLYPLPADSDEFENDLSKYKRNKSSVQFPFNEPVPLDLIRRIVLFNINKNNTKIKQKQKEKPNADK